MTLQAALNAIQVDNCNLQAKIEQLEAQVRGLTADNASLRSEDVCPVCHSTDMNAAGSVGVTFRCAFTSTEAL